MKKVLLVLLVLLLAGCKAEITYSFPETDSYDMSGYNLETDNFYKISISEFLVMVEQQKTFICYFGYESCPWCNDLLPILDEVCNEYQLKIYYLDFLAEENQNDIESLEALNEFAKDYLSKDEEGNLKLFFPTVYYVQKGKLVNLHQGTVSNHDATAAPLTDNQKARLKYNLQKEFDSLFKEQ
ncbi:MAG: hypothetical protein ACI4WG_03780 [Erysipelotrichaceae bacterium]